MNYVPRGREQQQRANILRQILWKRRKKFGRNKGNIGDGGNPTKANPELGPNRDQVGSINWVDNGRTGCKKG